jgi:MATE family multidrug resistance protein
VIGIPLGYLFGFKLDMGTQGMWIGLIAGLTFASLFLVIRFLRMSKQGLKESAH